MKRFLIGLVALMSVAAVWGRTLGYIETNGSWIYLYDEAGKRYKTMSLSSAGEVVGWSSTFFVTRSGSWIYLYNAEGKRYKTLSVTSTGEVIGVSGNSFTTRSGSWIYTYNSQGKRINTRSANH